jgi:hypothetical protein
MQFFRTGRNQLMGAIGSSAMAWFAFSAFLIPDDLVFGK